MKTKLDDKTPYQPCCIECRGKKLLLLEILGVNIKVYCVHCGAVQYFYLPLVLEDTK